MYDLIVIGGGSGGVAAARRAASYNAKVLLIEKADLGGTCVNLGCVPKKLFVYASAFKQEFLSSKNYGWDVDVKKFNWKRLIENKNTEIKRLNDIYKKMLLNASIDIVKGEAKFLDKNTIIADGKNYKGKKILIATGSKYKKMNFPGGEFIKYSDDVFYLEKLPNKVAIVGGGYIAVEFASIFNALGVDTTLIIRGKKILKEFDHKSVDFLKDQLAQKGIKFLFEQQIQKITEKGSNKIMELFNGQTINANLVVSAVGRVPNSANLGLDQIGIDLDDKNFIKINSHLQTSVSNIFAVGDVTGNSSLTPVAIRDGRAFADREFHNKDSNISYKNISTTIFSQPNFASIGITEEQAVKKSIKMDIYTASFRPMRNSIAGIDEKAFLKILVNQSNDKVEGMHIVAEEAGEIIQGFASAMQVGITKSQLDETMAIHPTLAEEFVTMYKKSYSI